MSARRDIFESRGTVQESERPRCLYISMSKLVRLLNAGAFNRICVSENEWDLSPTRQLRNVNECQRHGVVMSETGCDPRNRTRP